MKLILPSERELPTDSDLDGGQSCFEATEIVVGTHGYPNAPIQGLLARLAHEHTSAKERAQACLGPFSGPQVQANEVR